MDVCAYQDIGLSYSTLYLQQCWMVKEGQQRPSAFSVKSYSDRQSGSFGTTVDDFLDSSISYDPNEPKGKERTKKRAERTHSVSRSRSPYERRRSTHRRSRIRGGSRRSTRSPSQKRTPTHSSSQSKNRGRNGRRSSSRSKSRGRNGTRRKRAPTLNSFPSKTENRHRPLHVNNSGTPYQTRVLPGQIILEQNGIVNDLKSLSLEEAADLTNRPKIGGIYDEVKGNLTSIKERLKYLSRSQQMLSTDEGMEIADAAYLLRLLKKPEHEIELAGQLAHSGALLMLQADMLAEKGRELLAQSKRKLKLAVL